MAGLREVHPRTQPRDGEAQRLTASAGLHRIAEAGTAEQRGEFGRGRAQPLRLLRHCLARHAPYRTGDADRADAAPGKITHRQGDAAHVLVELAAVVGDALARTEGGREGEGWGR